MRRTSPESQPTELPIAAPEFPAGALPARAAEDALPVTRPPKRSGVSPDAWALIGLALATLWVYLPVGVLRGGILYGSDSLSLHVRRLEFARENLFGTSPRLPAWYPREFLGTPFWSNLQNFPLLPTRLPLLLVDPWSAHGFGANLAAVLTALFTYLWCRRVGVGRLGAAASGWTFACCGFFASRVWAGHLPLLEAYPGLPLLLWLVECYAASRSVRIMRLNLGALGLVTGTLLLAGHPQLPLYAIGAALIYLPVRLGLRKAFMGAAAMAAGVACMSFSLYPMALLIGRSTRILPLAKPANDVAFTPGRLKAFVLPWSGVPADLYVSLDTGVYVGLLPLVAVAFLLSRWAVTRRSPGAPWVFVTVLGTAALLLAFPRPWSDGAGGSWTILRSPARQLYLTVFALAAAAGYACDALLCARLPRGPAWLAAALVCALAGVHAWDVRTNVARFITAIDPVPDPGIPPALKATVGEGRIAMDTVLVDPINRRMDDVGVFDSILLARPYRAIMALSGQPPETNKQLISGADLGTRTLAWTGVRAVLTTRKDLKLPVLQQGSVWVYAMPGSLPRVGFVSSSGIDYADEDTVLLQLRNASAPDPKRMSLPPSARSAGATRATSPVSTAPTDVPAGNAGAAVTYRRPGPDQIEIDVNAAEDGYVRVLEAFDPGWSATVDGRPTPIEVADGFVSAVPVGAGRHEIRMTYRTPGVVTGLALSGGAALALASLLWAAPRIVSSSRSA